MEKVTLYNLDNEIIKAEGLESGISVSFHSQKLVDPEVSVHTLTIPPEFREGSLKVIKIFLEGSPMVRDQPTQMS